MTNELDNLKLVRIRNNFKSTDIIKLFKKWR